MREYFLRLGLDYGASIEDVKNAHRKLIKEWHPDRFSANDPRRQEAEIKSREINQALTQVKKYLKSNRIDPRAYRRPPAYSPADRDREMFIATMHNRTRTINPQPVYPRKDNLQAQARPNTYYVKVPPAQVHPTFFGQMMNLFVEIGYGLRERLTIMKINFKMLFGSLPETNPELVKSAEKRSAGSVHTR